MSAAPAVITSTPGRPKPPPATPTVTRRPARTPPSHRQRHRMDLVRLVAGPFVDALDRFRGRCLREAVHGAGLWVRPGAFEVHALFSFYRQVGLMGLHQLLGRDAVHSSVYVHVPGHRLYLLAVTHRRRHPRAV